VAEARQSITAYFDCYNRERLHQALDYRAPRQVFEEAMPVPQASAREKNRWR
jgi:transposase InsO family protein